MNSAQLAGVSLTCVLLLSACRDGAPKASGTSMRRFQFTDVALEAGLAFKHSNGERPLDILQTTGSGIAWIDYDRDDRPDLFCVNAAPAKDLTADGHRLYRNLGDGRFEDVTDRAGVRARGHYGMAAAVGDADGDGWPDLLVTGYGANHLFRNQRNGTFLDVTASIGLDVPRNRSPLWSTAAAFFDSDGDSDLDLYITNYCEFGSASQRFCEIGEVRTACPPTHYQGQADRFYENVGNGRFRMDPRKFSLGDRKPGRGLGILPFDAEGDGRTDVYVANDGNGCFFFHNEGRRQVEMGYRVGLALDGGGADPAGMGVDVFDYDGDGRLDLALGNFQDMSNLLFRQEQPLQFRDVSEEMGLSLATRNVLTWGARFADFDLDARPELLFVNGHVQDNIDRITSGVVWEQRAQLLALEGTAFVDVSSEAGPAFQTLLAGRGCALADYDGDGDEDIAVAVNGGPVQLWRNDSRRGHWLRVALRGRKPNTEAIGAKVTVKGDGKSWSKHVLTGRSYLSDSERVLTFGLGEAANVSEVEVQWPDGRRQKLSPVRVDQVLKVEQEA